MKQTTMKWYQRLWDRFVTGVIYAIGVILFALIIALFYFLDKIRFFVSCN